MNFYANDITGLDTDPAPLLVAADFTPSTGTISGLVTTSVGLIFTGKLICPAGNSTTVSVSGGAYPDVSSVLAAGEIIDLMNVDLSNLLVSCTDNTAVVRLIGNVQ